MTHNRSGCGSATRNAAIFRTLLDTPDDPSVAGLRDAVALNAAAALVAFDAAGGSLPFALPAPSAALLDRIAAALPQARGALDDGRARALLERWISTSQELS